MKAYEFKTGEELVVYADGSSRGNGSANARGGWGFVILDKTEEYKRFENWGAEIGATNNQMELRAAIEAIESLPVGTFIHMKVDSKYVMDGATMWVKGWVKNGWRTAAKAPVKNEYLWRRLLTASTGKHFKWTWVKGHSEDRWNEYVDSLCTGASAAI